MTSAASGPVFVIGAPRSATTAMARALASHPGFWTSDETFFLSALYGQGRADAEHRRWASRPSSSWLRTEGVSREEFFAALGSGIDRLFASRSGGRRWIDHTPENTLMADDLAAMFPEARFVHVLRDGRRVVHSMIHVDSTLESEERSTMRDRAFLPAWSRDFREACCTWAAYVRAGEAFCRRLPERALTIAHADVERDPAATMAAVLDFLGAPRDNAPARFLAETRINSSFAAPGGAPAAAADPWAAWPPERRRIFAAVAGDELCRLGFAARADIEVPRGQPVGDGLTPINALMPGRRPAWNEAEQRSWHPDVIAPGFWEAAGVAWDYSLVGFEQLAHLHDACLHLFAAGVPGDFVDCGVMLGGTTMFLAELCRRHGQDGRRIHALDTFRGSLRRDAGDVDRDGNPVGSPQPTAPDIRSLAEANIRSVDPGLGRVSIVPGDVCETARRLPERPIALLRLDTDTYATTRAELEILYPRVSCGGIVVVANHDWSMGQRAAVADYFRGQPPPLFRIDGYARAMVKPAS